MRYMRKSWNGDTRGTATLELAVVLPVLFSIGFGIFEFGNIIYNYHLISNGVRDAARYASGLPQGSADSAAKSIALTGRISGTEYRISWWTDPTTISITPILVPNNLVSGIKEYRGPDPIVMVRVQAIVPYSLPLGFLGYLGLGPITLTATHEERLFGVR